MSDDRKRVQRYRVSFWMVAIHSFMILLLGFVTGSSALNDQSPLMLLPVVLYIADYPVHMLLQQFVTMSQSAGYLTLVLLLGGVYWFLIGMIVRALFVTARHDAHSGRSTINEVT